MEDNEFGDLRRSTNPMCPKCQNQIGITFTKGTRHEPGTYKCPICGYTWHWVTKKRLNALPPPRDTRHWLPGRDQHGNEVMCLSPLDCPDGCKYSLIKVENYNGKGAYVITHWRCDHNEIAIACGKNTNMIRSIKKPEPAPQEIQKRHRQRAKRKKGKKKGEIIKSKRKGKAAPVIVNVSKKQLEQLERLDDPMIYLPKGMRKKIAPIINKQTNVIVLKSGVAGHPYTVKSCEWIDKGPKRSWRGKRVRSYYRIRLEDR